MKTTLLIILLSFLSITGPAYAGSCCSAASCSNAAADKIPGTSVYQLDSVWTNDLGQTAHWPSLEGKVRVVVMFFSHCNYACPLLAYKAQQVENALPENIRTNVAFTLVSFDVQRDTPAALHEYRAQHNLSANWTLLDGNDDGVLELAAALGVKFKKDSQGQFQHSNVITVLKSNGEIAGRETGLDLQTDSLVQQIEKLVTR